MQGVNSKIKCLKIFEIVKLLFQLHQFFVQLSKFGNSYIDMYLQERHLFVRLTFECVQNLESFWNFPQTALTCLVKTSRTEPSVMPTTAR